MTDSLGSFLRSKKLFYSWLRSRKLHKLSKNATSRIFPVSGKHFGTWGALAVRPAYVLSLPGADRSYLRSPVTVAADIMADASPVLKYIRKDLASLIYHPVRPLDVISGQLQHPPRKIPRICMLSSHAYRSATHTF